MRRAITMAAVAIAALATILLGSLIAGQSMQEKERKYLTPESEPIIIGPPGSDHHHSTFLIFINGELARLDNRKYFEASPHAHLHSPNFAEIHTHATNVTLGFFFSAIGIEFNSTCIALENKSHCNNSTHDLKFYVDGKPDNEFGRHKTEDWEHYLITYGDEGEKEIQEQIERVPDPRASPPPPGKKQPTRLETRNEAL